jgi:hypothetical protein
MTASLPMVPLPRQGALLYAAMAASLPMVPLPRQGALLYAAMAKGRSLQSVAEPELKSRGGQFHKLMLHLARCYYLPACACSMNKRSQRVR